MRSKKFEFFLTYSHTNVRPYHTIEVLKRDSFFCLPFFNLLRGNFSVFLDKHSQGLLGVKGFGDNLPFITKQHVAHHIVL
jgi:hypothetical protein